MNGDRKSEKKKEKFVKIEKENDRDDEKGGEKKEIVLKMKEKINIYL